MEHSLKDGVHYLQGRMQESSDFMKLFEGISDNHIRMNLKDLTGLTSLGVKRWIDGIRAFPELKITIDEASIEFIDFCNMIKNFMGEEGDQVHIRSFYVCYFNEKTEEEMFVLLKEEENFVKGKGLIQAPDVPQGMMLDGDFNYLFSFLTEPFSHE